MASLLETINAVTDGLDIDAALGGQVGAFLQMAGTVEKLVDQPPAEVAGYFTALQEVKLPTLDVGGDIGDIFKQLTPDLQGALGGLIEPITQALSGVRGRAQGNLGASLAPLLQAISQLNTLINSDWSAGLVTTHVPPGTPVPPPAPGESPSLPAAPSTPVILQTNQVTRAKALVDTLPASMHVKDLLIWMHGHLGTARPDYFYFRAIPLLDDVRDPLDSLVRWHGMTGAQLAQEFSDTLQRVATLITQHTRGTLQSPFANNANAAVAALPSASLKQASNALVTALQALSSAVVAGNTANITVQLAAAEAALVVLGDVNDTLGAHASGRQSLQQALRQLPADMETHMGRLLVLLTPRASWADLAGVVAAGAPSPAPDAALAETVEQLTDTITAFVSNLLKAIDIAPLTGPLTNVVTELKAGIAQLQQALIQFTSTAHAQFAQAQQAIDAVGLDDVAAQAEQAIETATTQIQQSISQGLQPVIEGLTAAVSTLEDALGQFDPEQLAAPVQNVMAGIKEIFDSAALADALAQLQKLKSVAKQLDELSFTPVTNDVIKGIDSIRSALASIDSASLSAPMPELIAEAMKVLPASVKPITDPLIGELATLIEQGPVPALAELKDLPKATFDELRKLEPKRLLGDAIGQPFDQLREKLGEFKPSRWLDAADTELDGLRQRLRKHANPGLALQPVTAAFEQFVTQLEAFDPGALLGPVSTQLEDILGQLEASLPDLDFIQQLQALLARIESLCDVLTQGLDVARHVLMRLDALSDPAAQFDVWLDEIFAKLTDASAFAAALMALQQAVASANAAALQAAWQAQRQGLAATLGDTDARALHTRIVTARQAIPAAAVAALPASATKTALQTFLASFNPVAPAFAAPFQAFIQLQEALTQADTGLTTVLATWDTRYCRPDGVLQSVVQPGASLEDIRQWIRTALDRQLGQPVLGVLSQLKVLAHIGDPWLDGLESLNAQLQQQLTAITAVPQALLELYGDLQEVMTQLSQLDLDVLQAEVDALYDSLIKEVRALDPRRIENTLQKRFEALLSTLSLSAVITPQVRKQIDDNYAQLLKIVDTLDPQLLLVEPMQTQWEQDIVPLLDAFDISETVDVLITFMQALDEKLASEMQRVDQAYQAMLAAAPVGGSSASAATGVGVG